jgi:hypothetical protein
MRSRDSLIHAVFLSRYLWPFILRRDTVRRRLTICRPIASYHNSHYAQYIVDYYRECTSRRCPTPSVNRRPRPFAGTRAGTFVDAFLRHHSAPDARRIAASARLIENGIYGRCNQNFPINEHWRRFTPVNRRRRSGQAVRFNALSQLLPTAMLTVRNRDARRYPASDAIRK